MSISDQTLDRLGFLPTIQLATVDWTCVPDTPGVYVIFDGREAIYVGMAGRNGKGSLRRRLRDHASGQVVNMFTQYLLFDRVLDPADLPRSPQEAKVRCRAYVRARCKGRVLPLTDGSEARAVEMQLRRDLAPTLNAVQE